MESEQEYKSETENSFEVRRYKKHRHHSKHDRKEHQSIEHHDSRF